MDNQWAIGPIAFVSKEIYVKIATNYQNFELQISKYIRLIEGYRFQLNEDKEDLIFLEWSIKRDDLIWESSFLIVGVPCS